MHLSSVCYIGNIKKFVDYLQHCFLILMTQVCLINYTIFMSVVDLDFVRPQTQTDLEAPY